MIAPVGAHASALMALRSKSLQAYGVNPKALVLSEDAAISLVSENVTRTIAKSKREERALAIQSEHSLVAVH